VSFTSPPATARSAAAFGRAFASRYGSDLLALRLHLTLQSGDAVLSATRFPGGCPHFARQGASPSVPAPFALPLRMGAFWRGWLAQADTAVLVRGSNYDRDRSPRFHRQSKLPSVSHSASAEVCTPVQRFLIAAGRKASEIARTGAVAICAVGARELYALLSSRDAAEWPHARMTDLQGARHTSCA
jgi:hypothetical protein